MNVLKRAIAAFTARGRATADYKGASTARRLKSWIPSESGVNSLLLGNLDLLRARSRALVRENAWAAGTLDRFVANAIGTGIKPQSRHPDEATRARIEATWLRWTDESDSTGMLDFYGQQAQVCRAERQDGEVFIRFRPRRLSDGLTVPLQLQVLEADYVPVNENRETGTGSVRGGIVFNRIGRREGYLMYREHPGEMFGFQNGLLATVPASEILHVYRPLRPGQLRGQPWLTPAIVTLYDLEQYVDATVLRAKLANLLAFFVKKSGEETETFNEEDQGDGTALAGVQPGSVHYLDLNEDVVFNQPVDPGSDFKEFLRSMLRSVATALGVTYEQLSGDLEGVNYSSIRAGVLEFRRWCEAFQHQVIVYQFCRPVWRAWIEAAVLAGVFSAREYAQHPERYLDVEWIPPKWDWVDPQKDLEAALGKVRAGFTSRRRVVAELGTDVEQIDREIAQDNARADGLGLKLDSDGRQQLSQRSPAHKGQQPQQDQGQNQEALVQ